MGSAQTFLVTRPIHQGRVARITVSFDSVVAIGEATDFSIGFTSLDVPPRNDYLGNDRTSCDFNNLGLVYGAEGSTAPYALRQVMRLEACELKVVRFKLMVNGNTLSYFQINTVTACAVLFRDNEEIGRAEYSSTWKQIRFGVCGRDKGLVCAILAFTEDEV